MVGNYNKNFYSVTGYKLTYYFNDIAFSKVCKIIFCAGISIFWLLNTTPAMTRYLHNINMTALTLMQINLLIVIIPK